MSLSMPKILPKRHRLRCRPSGAPAPPAWRLKRPVERPESSREIWVGAFVLAYHADDEIARVRGQWLVGLFVVLAAVLLVLFARRRGADDDGPNWLSRIAMALAVVVAPFAWLGPLLYLVPPFFLAPVTVVGLAIAGLVRRPLREPRLAIVAFALAGLSIVWLTSEAAACFATDACFH